MDAGVSRRGRASLQQFQLQGVRETGRKVGDGSYATVVELDFRGLMCVGKKIHRLLYDKANALERVSMLERFADECELLSQLHHPCIVQFLGVYFEPGSRLPVLVMEYLHSTLSDCIDRYGILPREIRYGILRDVILGLRYLHEHSPTIIHRDLSTNNVLLTANMSAKISDLGVAKILNLSPVQIMTQTQAPGTPSFMPPEALVARPKYDNKVDIFSYGVIMIHVLSGQWPIPSEAFTSDSANPGAAVPVSEIDRRAQYLQEVNEDRTLIDLIHQCLSNSPPSRPKAADIFYRLEALIPPLPPSLENRVEMVQRIQSQSGNEETTVLRNELEMKTREIQAQRDELEARDRDIEALRSEIERQRDEAESQRREIEAQKREIEACGSEVRLKSKESATLGREVQALREENESHKERIKSLEDVMEWQLVTLPDATSESKLQWRKCADLPVEMAKAQSVLVGGKVCVGGGDVNQGDDRFRLFLYDPTMDEWSALPPCPVRRFALSQFRGHIITVGGVVQEGNFITNRLHCYNEGSQTWEEYLVPMLTARRDLSAISVESVIIACGGVLVESVVCAEVEVYTAEAGRWHATSLLPIPCHSMTSTVISGTLYLLGGYDKSSKPTKTVLYTPLSSVVKKASSLPRGLSSMFRGSLWKRLPETPLKHSTAASVSGCLQAVGGSDKQDRQSLAVYTFQPQTKSWVGLNRECGDLPASVRETTAIQLCDRKLLVCGGYQCSDGKKTKSVFLGSIARS